MTGLPAPFAPSPSQLVGQEGAALLPAAAVAVSAGAAVEISNEGKKLLGKSVQGALSPRSGAR